MEETRGYRGPAATILCVSCIADRHTGCCEFLHCGVLPSVLLFRAKLCLYLSLYYFLQWWNWSFESNISKTVTVSSNHRSPTDSTPSSLRSSQDISRDLDQRISASLQRDFARVILKRILLTVSRDTPSSAFSNNCWSVLNDLCLLVYFDWLKSDQRLRFCQHDVILSRNPVRLPASFFFICQPFPDLCLFSHLLCSGHDLSISSKIRMNCCRLFVAMVISSASTRSSSRTSSLTSYTLDDFNMWNVFLILVTKWVSRIVVFDFFSVVALSETDGFVMSTGLFVGTCQMETSTRRVSADPLGDDLSILSRSPDPLHRHRPLSWTYSPCRWVTTLMRTESGRLNLIFMRGSLMWTGSEMSQMSFSPHVWSRRLCPFDFCQMSRSDDDTLTLLEVRFGA